MNLQGKKILVTGADGFIGSHLVEALLRQGHSVRAFVYYNSFHSWGWLDSLNAGLKKEIDVFMGDIRDPNGVRTAMKDCDVVFHLAALIAIPYSYHSPDAYVETNIRGTLNILQAARDLGVQKIIHTSTSEVYGTAKTVPITEDHPLRGQSPYAATKIGADQLAISFFDSFDLPVTILRPFNTYGPRQSARAVIPAIISQILAGKREVKLGSTHPTRDFNYVADTVAAFIAIAESKNSVGQIMNAGTGFEITIGATAEKIAALMNTVVEFKIDSARLRPENSEVERLCADSSKLQKLTSWKPVFAGNDGFEKGLKETIQWFTKTENLAKYKADVYAM